MSYSLEARRRTKSRNKKKNNEYNKPSKANVDTKRGICNSHFLIFMYKENAIKDAEAVQTGKSVK